MKNGIVRAAAVMVTAVTLAGAGGAATAASATTPAFAWNHPSVEVTSSALNGVSCASPSLCMSFDGSGNAYEFNGARWSEATVITQSLGATLTSASCVSSGQCVATDNKGHSYVFDGTTWSGSTVVDASSHALVVSCTSATFCLAVSVLGAAFTYNGMSWSSAGSLAAVPGNITSVSCASPSMCIAVAMGEAYLYNGTSWGSGSIVDQPAQSSSMAINTVSCPTTSFCAASDAKGNALTFNGSTWTAPSSIDTRSVNVSCTNATFCVGTDGNSSLTFDGTSWTAPALIDFGNFQYGTLSCAGSSFCVGVAGANQVGQAITGSAAGAATPTVTSFSPLDGPLSGGTRVTVTGTALNGATAVSFGSTPATGLVVNSTTSVTVTAPAGTGSVPITVTTPGGTSSASGLVPYTYANLASSPAWSAVTEVDGSHNLDGVSCQSATFCVAVDVAGNALVFNGSTWGTPVATGAGTLLDAVSCPTATTCFAAGVSSTAFVTTNGGSSWSKTSGTLGTTNVYSMSCVSASTCFAAGFVQSLGTPSIPTIVATTNGGATWAAQTLPQSVTTTGSQLVGISCADAMDCVAVSNAPQAGGPGIIVATTDGGSTWTAQTAPSAMNPAGGNPASFTGVSCPTALSCVATLSDTAASGAIAQTSNGGSTWTMSYLPNPDQWFSSLSSVSCVSSNSCMTVGSRLAGPNGPDVGVASTMTGGSWTAPVSVYPRTDLASGFFSGVSCASTSMCVAVGGSGAAAVYELSSITPPTSAGYWMLGTDGTVYPFGSAGTFGNATFAGGIAQAIVSTPDKKGLWVANNRGEIDALGDATAMTLTGAPMPVSLVSIARTPDGGGLWGATASGQILTSGDATNFGSPAASNLTLAKGIVNMVATPDGKGYWLLGGDGGVFSYGDAGFFGSTGNMTLNQPAVAMTPTPDGKGYWFVASDGGIFAFGDAGFYGSSGAINPSQPAGGSNSFVPNKPINGMVATSDGKGYWMVAADGGVFAFGDAGFVGSLGGNPPATPIVGFAS